MIIITTNKIKIIKKKLEYKIEYLKKYLNKHKKLKV